MALTHRQASIFVNSGKKGSDNYNSIEQPFMMQNEVADGETDFKTAEVNEMLENIQLHTSLKRIYQIIGNPAIEYYYNQWTLFSLNKVKEHIDFLAKENQTRFIDFGIIYAGMGHCIMVSYVPEFKKIFYRVDGGSNGWDRESNFKFASNYIPEEDKCVELSTWLDTASNAINVWDIKTIN